MDPGIETALDLGHDVHRFAVLGAKRLDLAVTNPVLSGIPWGVHWVVDSRIRCESSRFTGRVAIDVKRPVP